MNQLTVDQNVIPPITDPRGSGWSQPSTEQILIDDDCAMMPKEIFDNLAEYSTSTPTGVYPGKIWKAKRKRFDAKRKVITVWYLRWYGLDDGDPRGLPTFVREIVLV